MRTSQEVEALVMHDFRRSPLIYYSMLFLSVNDNVKLPSNMEHADVRHNG